MVISRIGLSILLILLSAISLFFISATDRFFFKLFSEHLLSVAVLADLRVPSFLIALGLFLFVRRRVSISTKVSLSSLMQCFALAAIWLGATAYFVLVRKVWVPDLPRWIDVVAFIVTGLLAEEFFFRGALFEAGKALLRDRKLIGLSLPVLLTAVLFSLQHLGYHDWTLSSAVVAQISYTFVMGIVFGVIRERSNSLFLVIALHVMTNAFTLLRNF